MNTEPNNTEFSPPNTIEDLLNLPKDLKMNTEDGILFLNKIYDSLASSVEIGSETPEVQSFFNHREIYEGRISIAHGILGRYILNNERLQEYSMALNGIMRNQTGSKPDMRVITKEKHEPISNKGSPIGMAMKHIRKKIKEIQKTE